MILISTLDLICLTWGLNQIYKIPLLQRYNIFHEKAPIFQIFTSVALKVVKICKQIKKQNPGFFTPKII